MLLHHRTQHPFAAFRTALYLFLILGIVGYANAQMDQGSITGMVQDMQHARVTNAVVTITNPQAGLVLRTMTNRDGVYTISPVRSGHYTVTANAPGFVSVRRENVIVDVNQRSGVNFELSPGTQTSIEVSAQAVGLQTEQASIDQVFSSHTLETAPLEGRNYVYLAQLAPGVDPPNPGARGANRGDFSANGQRTEENNFILDGVDNNSNLTDLINGASYVIKPPPDALEEFKVETSNYSAELGHSAGAVVNASIKSGTNEFHGSLWEYIRNDSLNAKDYFAATKPVYRQNQFGATIGGPFLKNKLFFFADAEANRVIFGETSSYTVPTIKMRTGDFSELLNPALSGVTYQRKLYQPGSGGATPIACNGQQNVICASQIDPVAQKLINLYPLPNLGVSGQTANNYRFQGKASDNTTQYDLRADWNIGVKDLAFARYSYSNNPEFFPPPLGALDGGSFGSTGSIENEGRNCTTSETHFFSPSLSNEARFGYNWIRGQFNQVGNGQDISAQYGLGGIPYSPGQGGLPYLGISNVTSAGSPRYYRADESENVAQLLDNVTKQLGKQTFKTGFNLQRIRYQTLEPQQARGSYIFSGKYTQTLSKTSQSGWGSADFLLNQIATSSINNVAVSHDQRWYRAAYLQDDWKVLPNLTLNLGLRYDYFQPEEELDGRQANFVPDYATGTGQFLIPRKSQGVTIPSAAASLFAQSNISILYTDNASLVTSQKNDLAPRIGFAFSPSGEWVIRGAFGLFYGGLESIGYGPDIGQNVPFITTSTFPANSTCKLNSCPSNGQTLETGFSAALAAGLANYVATPTLHGFQSNYQTPYTEEWNLTVERQLSKTTAATLSYVGNTTRHLPLDPDPNQSSILVPVGGNVQAVRPFNLFGGGGRITLNAGFSDYNSLQAKVQRRYSNGLSFLGTYTWSHALDDAFPPLGGSGDTFTAFRNWRALGFNYDYGSSYQDVRHRATVFVTYELPLGRGHRYAQGKISDLFVGGWSSSLLFRTQTGTPLLVFPSYDTTQGVGKSYALKVGDPFKPGNIATVNTGITCATQTKTIQTWFNPCAFTNPPAPSFVNGVLTNGNQAYGSPGRTMVSGPGFNRTDLAVFKSFHTAREQSLQFRAEAFNLFNTPSLGQPGTTLSGTAGQITNSRYGGTGLAAETPDARSIQLALHYSF